MLFGLALLRLGARVEPLVEIMAMASDALFDIVGIIMRLAPIGAFGAMAFTVGRYGIGSLVVARQADGRRLRRPASSSSSSCSARSRRSTGFSLLKFLRYIGEEILIVLGTSSSESALPRLMAKLEHLGCAKPVVGLVVPTGYSFNLDGTSIYMTMAAMFVAQASGVHLSLAQELGILACCC